MPGTLFTHPASPLPASDTLFTLLPLSSDKTAVSRKPDAKRLSFPMKTTTANPTAATTISPNSDLRSDLL